MSRIHVDDATPDQVVFIAENLRSADEREVRGLTSGAPVAALSFSARTSVRTFCATYDGTPVILFGVGAGAIPEVGMPWLVATPDIAKFKIAFLRHSRQYLLALRAEGNFKIFRNIADMRNDLHVKYLTYLGAKFYGGKILKHYRRFEFRF